MKKWKLGYDGFIMQYMIAGPYINEYSSNLRSDNQLELEAMLRSEIVSEKPAKKKVEAKLGEMADNGQPWVVYAPYGNCFIDVSDFYSTLQKIGLRAATVLKVPQNMEVRARIWTYMSVGIYCNGILVGEQGKPVYKPMKYVDVTLPLKEGENQLFFYCENLGVRDTRNILGVQILDNKDKIQVQLPDKTYQNSVYEDREFLADIKLNSGKLILPKIASEKIMYSNMLNSSDYEIMKRPQEWHSLAGIKTLEIQEDITKIKLRINGNGYELTRSLELTERIKPEYTPETDTKDEHFKNIMQRIANVSSLNRGKFGFAISNILARKHLGQEVESDKEQFLDTLNLIEKRVDCSDFLVVGLLRYMHNYEIETELKERIKTVLLNYRYWMNMDGADAMCFWSENHALMFYVSAMDVGNFYPNDYFPRAKMTGKELHEFGKDKVVQWIEDVEEYGFEEFLSGVYVCITFIALLNVIDYAEEDISKRARKITDILIQQVCRQTFKGTLIAPMGRVYRSAIYPFEQGSQSIINLIDPSAPYSYGEGWLSFLATSKYEFPPHLIEEMYGQFSGRYSSGNAEIVLEKNDAYSLTSVQSPREDGFIRWKNISIDDSVDINTDSHEFTKSLNERFHGTTYFQPGAYGYQQHMWYAALSPEAVVFVNHPGTTAEESSMRPGYWYGNGIMPTIKQDSEILGLVYSIPEDYPIQFTHIYCPTKRFDEVNKEEQWIFMKKDEGYIGLWSSGKMESYDDTIFDSELRVYEKDVAYLCVCGSREQYKNLEEFASYAKGVAPMFDQEKRLLQTNGSFSIKYKEGNDDTQYID